jgi:hypothetical protein
MTDEHLIEQHMLRLEHPEVDWTRHEGETSEQAIARWRVELKAKTKRRPRRTVAIEMLAQAIGAVQVAAAVVLILAAIGSGFAIIRALWRLAGRL